MWNVESNSLSRDAAITVEDAGKFSVADAAVTGLVCLSSGSTCPSVCVTTAKELCSASETSNGMKYESMYTAVDHTDI